MNKTNSKFIYSTNRKIETVDNKKDSFVNKTTEIHFRKKNGKNIVIIKFLSDDVLKLKKISKEIKESLAIGGSIKKGVPDGTNTSCLTQITLSLPGFGFRFRPRHIMLDA